MSHVTRRPARLVLAIVLVVLVVPVPADGAYRDVTTDRSEVVTRGVTLLAPAVGELPNGTLIGVTMRLDVSIRNGTGGVYVDTRPLTQIDMQGSARLAASVAASIAGRPFSEHDYFITMRADVPTVGGPSAGATMTIGFTALLLGLPLRDDVVMTGMINPDGSVGPVGGILEKAGAAHRAGAGLFLIPEGQAIVRRVTQEVVGEGWFPQVVEREERVNVTEYADEQWGMEVREMPDVYAAIEAFTDHQIERPRPPANVGPSEVFIDVMGDASATQLDDAGDLLVTLRQNLTDSDLDADSPNAAEQLGAVLDRAEARLARGERAAGNGSYYTASSLAFQAMVDLRLVSLWLDTFAADDQRTFLADHGQGLADRIAAVRARAAAADAATVSGLEAVGAAQVRVLEAERRLADAEAAHADDRISEAVEAMAFAEERTRSVSWWLDIAEELGQVEGGAALQADPSSLATDYFGIAQQAQAYAQVLLSQTGQSQTLAFLLQEANTALADAAEARSGGLDVGALYLSMDAQVASYAALSLVGSEDLLPDRIARQRDQALLNIDATRAAGAEPFLAVSYLDFAESLRGTDNVSALQMFGNAATIAASSRVLATGEVCGFGPVSCGQEAPAVSRLGFPAPDPWTAYLALATLLLGFMAGILITLLVQQARTRRHPARPVTPGAPVPMPLLTNGHHRVRANRPALPPAVPRPAHGVRIRATRRPPAAPRALTPGIKK